MLRKNKMICNNDLLISIKFSWLHIFLNLLIFYIKKNKFLVGLLITVDIIGVSSSVHKTFFIAIFLFYCIMAANHEYGHYIKAKNLELSNNPIFLRMKNRRCYIVYSLGDGDDTELSMLKVRFNAVFFDILSIVISYIYILTPVNTVTKISVIFLSVSNMLNYFFLFEGSDGYVIHQFTKKYGWGNLIKQVFNIRR